MIGSFLGGLGGHMAAQPDMDPLRHILSQMQGVQPAASAALAKGGAAVQDAIPNKAAVDAMGAAKDAKKAGLKKMLSGMGKNSRRQGFDYGAQAADPGQSTAQMFLANLFGGQM